MRSRPVAEVSPHEMWNYAFQAKCGGDLALILASDSLRNLKEEVRSRGWRLAWLTSTSGCWSYGQNIVTEYPYRPRDPKRRQG